MEHENTARTVSSMDNADPRPRFTPRQSDQFGVALGRLLFARNRWHAKPTHKRFAGLQRAQAELTNLLRSIMADQVARSLQRHLFELGSLGTDADHDRRQAENARLIDAPMATRICACGAVDVVGAGMRNTVCQNCGNTITRDNPEPGQDPNQAAVADIPEIDRLAKAARNAEIDAAHARADYAKAGIDAETALDIADLREHWQREVESKVQDSPAHPFGIPADQPPPIGAPAGKFDVICPRCNTTNRYPGGFPARRCGQCDADLADVAPVTPPPIDADKLARAEIRVRAAAIRADYPQWHHMQLFVKICNELRGASAGDHRQLSRSWLRNMPPAVLAAALDAVDVSGPNVLFDPDNPPANHADRWPKFAAQIEVRRSLVYRRGIYVTPDQAAALDAAEEMAVRAIDGSDGLKYADDIDEIIEEAKIRAFDATLRGLIVRLVDDHAAAVGELSDALIAGAPPANQT